MYSKNLTQNGGICPPCAIPLVVGAVGVGSVGYGMSKSKSIKSKTKKSKSKKKSKGGGVYAVPAPLPYRRSFKKSNKNHSNIRVRSAPLRNSGASHIKPRSAPNVKFNPFAYQKTKGGTLRRVKSATYNRTKNKNRKKTIKSVGSNPRLNLNEREQYMPRKNDTRKKFMTRLARRRNSRRLIGNDKRNGNTEIYNENRPLRDAKKRLAKSKSFLNKKYNKKPEKLDELPDELLHKIYEM